MKCPRCKGCGRAIVLVKQKEGFYATEQTVCPECNGKGIVEQTNEEWLHTLNTEQLADVFFDYRYINATPQQQLWLSANEDFVKCGIIKWLKEIRGNE